MDDSNDDQDEIIYVDKLKTKTFKKRQLEHQIKSGAMIPELKFPKIY
jgi:hypothetical protein